MLLADYVTKTRNGRLPAATTLYDRWHLYRPASVPPYPAIMITAIKVIDAIYRGYASHTTLWPLRDIIL